MILFEYEFIFFQIYYCRDKKKLGSPILVSIKRLILYHLGSVAFGAFIVALIQFLRILLSIISRR